MHKFDLHWSGETRQIDLADGEFRVGRALDCTISIASPSVSKHHALIRVEGDRIFVRDLGSTNGTRVDGNTLTKDEEVELSGTGWIQFADATLRRGDMSSTGIRQDSELASRGSFRHGSEFDQGARARILEMLSSLFELLSAGGDAEGIEEAACSFVSRWVRAERVVLLSDGGEGTGLRQSASWSRKPTIEQLQLSSSIVDTVIKQRESVLVADPAADSAYANNASIVALSLRSAMAAPLFDNERVRGILYVDTADPTVQYNMEDLQVLSATANAVAVKLRNLTLEGELKTAARIQKEMVPSNIKSPEGFELLCHQTMCRQVGGDLYHALERPGGKRLLALGDVSGKGMPAALAMSAGTVLLRALARLPMSIDVMIQTFHEQLLESLAPEQFLTLFTAELDVKEARLVYVNAGHNPPMIVRADGHIEELASTGLPIAMVPNVTWTVGETSLEPGELMAIFSDGIPEATLDGESFLGEDALKECFLRRRTATLEEIQADVLALVDKHLQGQPNSDDLTLMLLRRCL
jgi:serine phosphatase RsbU (regulator of sigma subunit)